MSENDVDGVHCPYCGCRNPNVCEPPDGSAAEYSDRQVKCLWELACPQCGRITVMQETYRIETRNYFGPDGEELDDQ